MPPTGFDAWGNIAVDEVQRHLDVNLLGLAHALEVDMLDFIAKRVHLVIAYQYLFLFAIQFQREDGSMERFMAELVEQFLVVQLDLTGSLPAP